MPSNSAADIFSYTLLKANINPTIVGFEILVGSSQGWNQLTASSSLGKYSPLYCMYIMDMMNSYASKPQVPRLYILVLVP